MVPTKSRSFGSRPNSPGARSSVARLPIRTSTLAPAAGGLPAGFVVLVLVGAPLRDVGSAHAVSDVESELHVVLLGDLLGLPDEGLGGVELVRDLFQRLPGRHQLFFLELVHGSPFQQNEVCQPE